MWREVRNLAYAQAGLENLDPRPALFNVCALVLT